MTNKWLCGVLRCAITVMGVAAVLVLCGTLATTAHADDMSTGSPKGQGAALPAARN